MLFGLCNAPATFATLINNIFHEYLDDFVIIYIGERACGASREGILEIPIEQVIRKWRQVRLG